MYYVDMDNTLCLNCNFQVTKRKKQRKIEKYNDYLLKKAFYVKLWKFCQIFNKNIALRLIF